METAKAPTAQDVAAEKQKQLDKIMAMTRRDRRPRLRIRHGASSRPFSRVRSGTPTGTTSHFRQWMLDLQAHSALQRLKLDALADAAATPGTVAQAFALLYLGKYKSVAAVQRATIEQLLAVPGIGLKRLEAVEKYLTDRNVPLAWTAA